MDGSLLEILHIVAWGLLALCCFAGIALQFFAWRHLKPGIPRFGHKDSLFKKKAEYYTEEGLVFIELQKRVMYVMLTIFFLYIAAIEFLSPGPPQ
ncbi:MAG: hypothetical protein RLW87_02260 [Alphaproteobacteria bacterium]|jgi:hypothetical protein|uniref:hypothetical protein n=1 Tax=Pacificispira sp. TaxID=2888761 RepID=UPI002ECCE22E|nr:hypothetical protein [Pseudomonadota bacterium]